LKLPNQNRELFIALLTTDRSSFRSFLEIENSYEITVENPFTSLLTVMPWNVCAGQKTI